MEGIILHPTQKPVALDPHRFRVLCCGRRWGKTTLAIDQMKGRASIPNSRIAYIAPTYQQARDIAWEQLKRECTKAAETINESRLEIKLVNGSLIVLRGWESIETLRGQKFDLVVLDEVAMMRNFMLHWQEVIRPTLTDTKGEGLFISTPKGFNHFYDLFNLEGKDEDFKSFHFSTLDNPHIPPEEIEKARQELPEDRFAQEYLADFRKTEGLVYKEFDRGRHTYERMPERQFVKTFGGHDFGTHNPCASITIKKDRQAIYWVTDEFYKTGLTDAQQADYVAALKWDECFPDPESASGILELKQRGVNVREVVKNKDSVRNGINVVRELLNTNRLRIHRSCQNLIWEFETYAYPDRRPDHNEEENPIKENDHALDALRYALAMDNALTVEQFHEPIPYLSIEEETNPAL
jgi:PBSX family phage terminase large subunit